LRQIAGAAAIDLATLKYHFGDKPTLFAEVYREGHERFVAMVAPHLAAFAECTTRADVRAAIGGLAADIVPWTQDEEAFARLVQFRLLEDSDDITGLEAELQDVAVSMLEDTFDDMHRRGVIRDVDVPALLVLFVTGLPMWFVAARVRPGWVGEPDASPTPEAFTDRVVAFVDDLLCSVLLHGDVPGGPPGHSEGQ
jgi:AcrR family transcriptional regulator